MPVVSVPRATLLACIVLAIVTSAVPSKETEPTISPLNAIVLAVAKAVDVSATTPDKLFIKVFVTLASIAEFALVSV